MSLKTEYINLKYLGSEMFWILFLVSEIFSYKWDSLVTGPKPKHEVH